MNAQANNRKMYLSVSLVILLALLLAACQPAAVPTTVPTVQPAPTQVPAASATAAIPETGSAMEEALVNQVTDPTLGDILVDGNGMTLYMFTKDAPNKSNCAGDCLKAWPPLLSNGSPQAGPGVDAALLGTAEMSDGSLIVTYHQMPLYYWAGDVKAGDTNGQDVNGVWYVVTPGGDAMMTDAKGNAKVAATAVATAMPTVVSDDDMYKTDDSASDDVKLMVANNATFGAILVDANGKTLYMFTKDGPNQSNCTAGCLAAWPPFIASSAVKAEDGVDEALIGTATLADGRMIVTYNQMPLYYWAGDVKAGETNGQGVNSVWYVVSPEGKPVGK